MYKIENLDEFYWRNAAIPPEIISQGAGHFNVFRVKDFVGPLGRKVPFNRKDYYKITLSIGQNRYSFADKVIETDKPALVFTNPMIPYKCERLSDDQHGYFCIFSEAFFSHFGNIRQYPVFEPDQLHIYHPSQTEVNELKGFYEQLLSENESSYPFKYDLIRAQVIQLIHKAIKMAPAKTVSVNLSDKTANARITSMFTELLQRQFPIPSSLQRIRLRTPTDFANQLFVHVNHLNRALKIITGKTTSQLIGERLALEAGFLLKNTDWNVAEIGYTLGFEDSSHFIGFFRKLLKQTPNSYRNAAIV